MHFPLFFPPVSNFIASDGHASEFFFYRKFILRRPQHYSQIIQWAGERASLFFRLFIGRIDNPLRSTPTT